MNEVEEEKQLLGSRLFDQIDAGLHSFGQAVASAAEDKEGWTDDAVRGTLGTLQWIGNLPVLKQLGQLEEGIVSGVSNLAERQDVIDPRLFTYGTRLGTAFIPYGGAVKTVGKLSKVSKAARLAKGAKTAFKQGNITMGLPSKGARIPDLLGDSSKVQNPIVGGLQEQFTSEGLKDVLLQQIDNPLEKFGKKLGQQVQKAVDETKTGIQRVLGRKADNIEVDPGYEAFALDPSSKAAQNMLLDAIARKSGYKGLGDFKKNVINKYPDPLAQEQLIYKYSKEGYGVGQIEHKIAKSSKKARRAKIEREFPDESAIQIDARLADRSKNTYDMDWYWEKEYIGRDGKLYTDGLGKGDRHSIFNTEITFDARRISLKNVVEGIGYGGEGKGGKALAGRRGALVTREGTPPGILVQSPNPADRIIVTIENTGSRKNIINRVGELGNIRLRRAGDNRLLGEIGDYVDALYPKTEEARDLLIKGLEAKGITDIAAWRRDQIYQRLKAIVDGQPTLPKTAAVRKQRIADRLVKDMEKLYKEFPFLRPQKSLYDEVTAAVDADYATRGQKQGPFLNKTQERLIQRSKIRRTPLPIPIEEIQQTLDLE